ncbi:MAG: hypothetical protein ACI9RO_002517 [Alteromonas macleodii]|jgi:hypothetical protein
MADIFFSINYDHAFKLIEAIYGVEIEIALIFTVCVSNR